MNKFNGKLIKPRPMNPRKSQLFFLLAAVLVMAPYFMPDPIPQVNKDSMISFQHEVSGKIYNFHLSEIFDCVIIENDEGMWCE
ncbi:MAG: hypothetical protein JKY93_12290 [Gammaproteobacteria bacterium]|nr:hypothetical protein [Gammaproteobacteria bacterium]